ncbi:MAG TPA: TetR/AcrR family transcriptional regulator [Candidatus Nanopelagicaceae bacterium]|nr:TetR/AcrR family transcriptional regulator [Candidatus Nanopelagicaceae bacterium]
MAGVASSRHSKDWPTRDRILIEASRLFATRGFAGTSTRDIARAVGVRQPSLYAHFTSKQSIAEELIRRDLIDGAEALIRLRSAGGGPAIELYRYLLWEVAYDRSTPFDLRAIYQTDLLELPEFSEGRKLLRRFDSHLLSVISRGMSEGDFDDVDPLLACRIVNAIVLETIRASATGSTEDHAEADEIADFVLRSLLTRRSRLAAIRSAAHRANARDNQLLNS